MTCLLPQSVLSSQGFKLSDPDAILGLYTLTLIDFAVIKARSSCGVQATSLRPFVGPEAKLTGVAASVRWQPSGLGTLPSLLWYNGGVYGYGGTACGVEWGARCCRGRSRRRGST